MAIGGAIRRRFRYSKHGCNQTRSVKANLLDDGIDDTLASVGTIIALHESPGPCKRALAQYAEKIPTANL
jgi:hypothetical protein